MKKTLLLTILAFLFFNFLSSSVFAKEVSFTQEDRDRLIRLEEAEKALSQRIDDLGKRIDDLRDIVYVVLGGIIALIGFVIWDRRTALSPAIKKNKELEERQDRIERALKELARKDTELAEILRRLGIL